MKKIFLFFLVSCAICSLEVQAQEVAAKKVSASQEFFEKPDPQAQEWAAIPESTVALLPQNITTPILPAPTVNQIQVRAIHNGKWLAIRLEWSDATDDYQVTTDRASDAVAIQFPLKDADKTSPFMGAKDVPVEIMQWKAVWQHDIDKGYQKVTDIYPNTYNETYQFGIKAAQQAGNNISNEQRKTPVEEYVAVGFGTLTIEPNQETLAHGKWKNGKWMVVFSRPLKSPDKNNPEFNPGDRSAVAFAVWEGGKKNVGSRKNYAMWVPIVFEK